MVKSISESTNSKGNRKPQIRFSFRIKRIGNDKSMVIIFTAINHAEAWLSAGVRLSVCLSQSCIVSKRLKMSSIFILQVAPIIIVFLNQALLPSKRQPSGALNKHEFRKIRSFRPTSRYILETVQKLYHVNPWLLWNGMVPMTSY